LEFNVPFQHKYGFIYRFLARVPPLLEFWTENALAVYKHQRQYQISRSTVSRAGR